MSVHEQDARAARVHKLSSDLADAVRTEGGSIDVLSTLVRRLAEIDDELESRGANALIAEKEAIRERVKDCMADADTLTFTEEISGYVARITPSYTDTWDLQKLVMALPRPEMADEALKTVADADKLKEWMRDGSISRLAMERAGALIRKLRSRALSVGPQRGDRRR